MMTEFLHFANHLLQYVLYNTEKGLCNAIVMCTFFLNLTTQTLTKYLALHI